MSTEISYEVNSGALKELMNGLEANILGPVLEVASRGMLNYFKDYHTEFAPKWRGEHYLPGGNAGRFGSEIVQGWQNPVRTSVGEVTVTNIHPYLAHKITGGPITPKRGKYLTIPIASEAKGRLVAEFETSKGVKLFRLGNTLAYRGPQGKAISVYALSKGVDQAPWPGALPPFEAIESQFVEQLTDAMELLKDRL